MKLRDVPALLGLRRKAKVHPFRVDTMAVGDYGEVRFAQWQHPNCRPFALDAGQIDQVRTFVSPGDAVLDIGAHIGDTSVLFALAAGPTGMVFAVEPNRYVLPTLHENAGLNSQAAPIVVMPYAATATNGPMVFNYSDPDYCNGGDLEKFGRLSRGHAYPLAVEGRNILAELERDHPEWLSRIKFIKTDTEGNDQAVVESLRRLITANRPYLLCEVYKRTDAAQRLAFFNLLTRELGYSCFRAEPYTEMMAEPVTAQNLERWKHFDIFCVPS